MIFFFYIDNTKDSFEGFSQKSFYVMQYSE